MASRCRANAARIRQSKPDCGHAFQVKVFKLFPGVPSSLESGASGMNVFEVVSVESLRTEEGSLGPNNCSVYACAESVQAIIPFEA
jgi:hypothetical protein